jgi:ribosomal protein S2
MYLNKLLIFKKLQQANTHLGLIARTGPFNYKWSRCQSQRYPSYVLGLRGPFGAIINLENTVVLLRRACNVIRLIIRANGHLLFVNTNPKYNKIIKHTAKYTNQSFVNHKWIGGFLTNWNHMQNVQQQFQTVANLTNEVRHRRIRRIRCEAKHRMADCEVISKKSSILKNSLSVPLLTPLGRRGLGEREARARGTRFLGSSLLELLIASNPRYQKMQKCFEGTIQSTYSTLSDNRLTTITRNIRENLQNSRNEFHELNDYGSIGLRSKEPDCVIILNANQNHAAIHEAFLNQIPIISIVDANIPNELYNLITYPIPGNSDSVRFVYFFCSCILKAILTSQACEAREGP